MNYSRQAVADGLRQGRFDIEQTSDGYDITRDGVCYERFLESDLIEIFANQIESYGVRSGYSPLED